MALEHKNLSPAHLRKHTLRAGLSALGLISAILILCAIFFAIGISRSAESNRIFELVTYQQTVAEKLAKQVNSLENYEYTQNYDEKLAVLQLTVDEARSVQEQITMPGKWGPMDAYEVNVLREAYQEEPLLIDQRFNAMMTAYDELLVSARQDHNIPTTTLKTVHSKTEVFISSQSKVIKLYLKRIDDVLDQSRWRISLTFLCTFLSLGAIGLFLLNPFSKRIESQAKAVEQVNEKLRITALRDTLTGLPNRLAITEHLTQELKDATEQDRPLAVAHIDIDHFKVINDKYGHAAGDYFLSEISKRMLQWEGEDNLVARFGGDEFVAVMSSDGKACTFEKRAEELLKLIETPINFEGITLISSASIGISIYPLDTQNFAELMVNADLALYEAKQDGRGCARFFNASMREALNLRKALEAELRTALDKGHLKPFFQPQVNIATRQLAGVEVLMRWSHETRGSIPPIEFLPVAESSGLMVRLGRHVMEKAIIEASKWHALNIPFGRLALNVSSNELHEADFVDWLLQTAKRYNLPANKLSIEILETVIMNDTRYKISEKLARLRSNDIHIELDDFGTGYASLQQVKVGGIDRLKIDRSFITNLHNDHCNFVIVNSILEMARKLDVDVIAEGAETIAELDTLMNIGCNMVQGFGIAKPMPASAISNWMNLFAPTKQDADKPMKMFERLKRQTLSANTG